MTTATELWMWEPRLQQYVRKATALTWKDIDDLFKWMEAQPR